MGEDDDRRGALLDWGREPELGELDALMWRTERHPESSWTGVVLHELDGTPDFARLRLAHERFVRLVPRFRQRVVSPLLPVGRPRWADDPGFDLAYHLRRLRLPEPGTRAQLLELAQTQGLVPLDRDRPPWTATLIEGLEGGRAAYALQVHHVLMDGAAFAQLHRLVLSPSRQPRIAVPIPVPARVATTSLAVTGDELARQARSAPGAALAAARTVGRSLAAPASAVAYARSVARVARPVATDLPPSLTPGSRRAWRFGTLECGLGELKAAGKAAGGTLNDAYVCALLGGLRRWCEAQGDELPDVPISMPVALRKPGQTATGGNDFAGAFFLAPSGVADPAERIRAMRRRVEAVRSEPALDLLSRVSPVLNRTPSAAASALMGSLTRAVLTTSSWPGLTEELFLSGCRFERMFVFAPLPHTALTAAMCTHVGTCCIAINADGETFADAELLWRCLREGLDEILALGPPGAAGAAPPVAAASGS